LFQSAVIGASALGEGIKCFFTPIECKQCIILREWLDIEREKRDYYEKLLLTKVGVLHDEREETLSTDSFQSIRHITTLSSLRSMARDISKKKSEESKTAADKFELELVKASNGS